MSKSKIQGSVSFDPDTMVSEGLPGDFDGEITRARYVPWDYRRAYDVEGTRDEYALAAAIHITPDDDDIEPFIQFYSAGKLSKFVPGNDDDEPAGGDLDLLLALAEGRDDVDDLADYEGTHALRVGRSDGLNRNTNWAFFLGKLREQGYGNFSNNISSLEGTRGHFDWIPKPPRAGLLPGEGGGSNDILVITELSEERGSSKRSTKKSKASSKSSKSKSTSTDDTDDDDLDSQLETAILERLAEEESLPVSKLAPIALKALPKALKGKGVKRVKDQEFLSSVDSWEYDPDDNAISLA